MRGLVESVRAELAPWNIEFSIACPPNVDTPMYAEENKYKPPEIKELEGKTTVVSPQRVAADIVGSLTRWRYFITTGTDSWLVCTASASSSPASFSELLAQILIAPILRIVFRFEVEGVRKKMRTYKNKL